MPYSDSAWACNAPTTLPRLSGFGGGKVLTWVSTDVLFNAGFYVFFGGEGGGGAA